MVRVTGGNSLIMNPLNPTSTEEVQKRAEDLTKILTGSHSKNTSGTVLPEYKEMQDVIGKLTSLADILTDSSGNSIFAKAEESGDTSKVAETAKEFVSQYNTLLKALDKSDAGTGYQKELSGIVSKNKDLLEKVGITVADNGSLKVDDEVFSKASIEDLKKLFMGDSSMAGKIADKSVYAGANIVANAYMNAYGNSGNYNAGGSIYEQMASLVGGYMDSIG